MFFSVIVPIFNVERFMERGMDCLCQQSFRDFEVVLVDDGSTDSSGEICDKFAESLPNVVVVHQANTGSGGARNNGIRKARGRYIAFYDIDDIVPSYWLERIHKSLIEFLPQVMVYGYEEVAEHLGSRNRYIFDKAFYKSNAELRDNYVRALSGLRFNNGFVWNKVYERQFLLDNYLWFENLRIQQDEVFNLAVYQKATKILVSNEVLYTYFVYPNGNTGSRYIPDRLDIYRRVRDAFQELIHFWQLEDEEFHLYVNRRFYDSVLHHLKYNLYVTGAGLTVGNRRRLISDVIDSKDVRECLAVIAGESRTTLGQRYYHAMVTGNIKEFERTRCIDRTLQQVKNLIRKILIKRK